MIGMTIALVVSFWSFGGKFQEVIDKHTGYYSNQEKDDPRKSKRYFK
jgi:hypothetical protein